MKDRDWVSTAQLYQSSLKTPGEARATSQNAWDTGIAEGVRSGLFGLGEIKEEKPVCRYFKTECSIAFTDNEVLIKAEISQAQMAAQQNQVNLVQGNLPSGTVNEPGASAFVPTASVTFPTAGRYQQLNFNFTVPKGKVSSLMGVLN